MKKIFALLTLAALWVSVCFIGFIPTAAEQSTEDVMYVDPSLAGDWDSYRMMTKEEGGTSNVRWRSVSGWGRCGYSGIQNMAAMLDGELSIDADYATEWNVRDLNAAYTADAVQDPTGKYNSLMGYLFVDAVTVDSVKVFYANDGLIEAFDVLGGKLNADGSIAWTVLAEGRDLQEKGGRQYDDSTNCFEASFNAVTIDCIQIGFVDLLMNKILLSELQLFRAGSGEAVTTTTAAPAVPTAPVDVMYVDPSIASNWNDYKVKTKEEGGITNVRCRSLNHVWGREGYSSILNMAAMLDGELSINAEYTTEWGIKSLNATYTADAVSSPDGRYNSMIGYDFIEPVTVDYARVFYASDGILEGFDIIGGTTGADGTIKWTVLGEGRDLQNKGGNPYDDYTNYYEVGFDPITIDCIQIGFVEALANTVYLSEMQLYQAGTGGATATPTTTAPPETTSVPTAAETPETTDIPDMTSIPESEAEDGEETTARVTTAVPAAPNRGGGTLVVLGILSAAVIAALILVLIISRRKK